MEVQNKINISCRIEIAYRVVSMHKSVASYRHKSTREEPRGGLSSLVIKTRSYLQTHLRGAPASVGLKDVQDEAGEEKKARIHVLHPTHAMPC